MTGPYGLAAQAYFDAGWSPVPFPANCKWPPVDGYTGVHGAYVDEVTLKKWLRPKARVSAGNMVWLAAGGNIGLRLPKTVLGIDVDMYEGKQGRETFAAAIKAWGELPATYYPTAREDGSGIRLFRIPEGLAWPGKLPQGGGVELVRWDHRYAMVDPSTNPDANGARYRWWVDGIKGPGNDFPTPDEVPDLPALWIEGLTSGKRWTDRPVADLDEADVRMWLSNRNGPEMCATMRRTLTTYQRKARQASDDGGTHDAGRDGAWAIIGDAHAGHAGVEKALAELRKTFIPATARRADERQAAEEWARIVIRGVQKVAAEGLAEDGDICALLDGGMGGGNTSNGDEHEPAGGDSGGSAHLSYARSDTGNAERLAIANRHDMRYVEGWGWLFWSDAEGRWIIDRNGEVKRRAIQVARAIGDEAEFLADEDPAQMVELKKWARKSESKGSLEAMISVASCLRGISVLGSDFDADPARLDRAVLSRNPGFTITPALPEHKMTMKLGVRDVASVEGTTHPDWDAFLDRFQPDPEIRAWLQKLVGYSLYGANPRRLFVVCFGPSSTGKTTFAEALRSALGDYAAAVTMTVFRDNQDDRPRPDLVRALRKRMIVAEETSQAWHLHADQVKRLTGGAPVVARGMRSDTFWEVIPAFTPWLLCNNSPTIEGADEAVRRRLVIVPWDQVILQSDEDDTMLDRLTSPEVAPAVLAWALEGWTMYAASRDLDMPAGALEAREKFLGELSDFDRALGEIAIAEPGASVAPEALYTAYKQWCTTNGIKPESNTKFGSYMSGRGFDKKSKTVIDDDGRHVVKVRAGIRLSEEFARLFGAL